MHGSDVFYGERFGAQVCFENGMFSTHHSRIEPSIVLGLIEVSATTSRSSTDADRVGGCVEGKVSVGIRLACFFFVDDLEADDNFRVVSKENTSSLLG